MNIKKLTKEYNQIKTELELIASMQQDVIDFLNGKINYKLNVQEILSYSIQRCLMQIQELEHTIHDENINDKEDYRRREHNKLR